MDGKLFVDWAPFDHPQLGELEIGGFVSKVLDEERGTYTNAMTTPGPVFEAFLQEHTDWNLWMASMSPLVRLTEVRATPEAGGYYRVTAEVRNLGYLPTNVTEQAIRNQTAKTVKLHITVEGGAVVFGDAVADVGHLDGNRGDPVTVEWMVRASGRGQPDGRVTAVCE